MEINEHLLDIVHRVGEQITHQEGRERKRKAEAQKHFLFGIEHLLLQLWKGTQIQEGYEGGINKRAGWYSKPAQYRDPRLTFKQTIAAYDGLIALGLVDETQRGHFSHETLEGKITRFAATDELLSLLSEIDEDPLKVVKPNLEEQCIVMRDTIDGRKQQVAYIETPDVLAMRERLTTINQCLARHYPDLRIKDEDWLPLQQRIAEDPDKQLIDLTRRTLVRIFSEGRFDRGGRFYRAWWQNVPSEYRKFITIDGKRTCEYDYSQLNPHMIYFLRDKELGSEDAYDRVLDGEHRDLVKEAFNAMIQASTQLNQKPRGIDLTNVEIDWPTLRDAVLRAHRAIEDMFFQGHGNNLQYIDSCIAEQVMLQFSKWDHPVLPVHDSFIMHYAFGDMGELEEAMRRAFHHHFKRDIKVKGEIGVMLAGSFDGQEIDELSFDELIYGEPEYRLWDYRN